MPNVYHVRDIYNRSANLAHHYNPFLEQKRFVGISSMNAKPSTEQLSRKIRVKGTTLDGRAVYLDSQATTPVDPRVLDAMLPYYIELYGNPHSRTHHYGWESEQAVENARQHIANLINADPREVIFTSGATESNNAALKGVAHFYGNKKKHIITLQIEHKCVLDTCRRLEPEGFEVTYLPVQKNGLVDLQVLEAAMRPDTVVVSAMYVNNEIGVINPWPKLASCVAAKVCFFILMLLRPWAKLLLMLMR